MKTLRLGILGVSNHFIKRIVLPASETSCIQLAAIASRSESKAIEAAKEFGIDQAYGSYEELLRSDQVDAVYIPLPNHLHTEWIKKAADAGKHILCEKPMCMHADEVIDVVEYCQKKDVYLMEAFMYKHHPQWQKARDVIRTNNIGKIRYISTSFSYNNPAPSNIRNIKEYGGGGLRDIGCYAISVPRFLLGREPKRVISLLNEHKEFGTDELSSAILDFGDTQATFTVSTGASAFQKVDIIGTAGRVTVDLPFNTYADTDAKLIVDSAIGHREILIPPIDQYGQMLEDFANMIHNKTDISAEEDDAINNQRVIDAIFKSSVSEKWENID